MISERIPQSKGGVKERANFLLRNADTVDREVSSQSSCKGTDYCYSLTIFSEL